MATKHDTAVKALAALDRDKINSIVWDADDDAVMTALVDAAELATQAQNATALTTVQVHSVSAYLLNTAGKLDRGEYAKRIDRSTSRIGDYVLYGRAFVVHGVTGERFQKMQAATAGGDRKAIREVLDQDEVDLDGLDVIFDAAIATEKEKAAARKAAGKKAPVGEAVGTDLAADAKSVADRLAATVKIKAPVTDLERSALRSAAESILASCEIADGYMVAETTPHGENSETVTS